MDPEDEKSWLEGIAQLLTSPSFGNPATKPVRKAAPNSLPQSEPSYIGRTVYSEINPDESQSNRDYHQHVMQNNALNSLKEADVDCSKSTASTRSGKKRKSSLEMERNRLYCASWRLRKKEEDFMLRSDYNALSIQLREKKELAEQLKKTVQAKNQIIAELKEKIIHLEHILLLMRATASNSGVIHNLQE